MKKSVIKLIRFSLVASGGISLIAACYINVQDVCIRRGTCISECGQESCYEPSLGFWVTWPVGIYAAEDAYFPDVLALAAPNWERLWENIEGLDSYVSWWGATTIAAIRYSVQKRPCAWIIEPTWHEEICLSYLAAGTPCLGRLPTPPPPPPKA